MTHHPPTHLTFEDIDLTIIDHHGQPWLSAADVAQALGYENTGAVTATYSRHVSEFTEEMALVLNMTIKGFGRGDSSK